MQKIKYINSEELKMRLTGNFREIHVDQLMAIIKALEESDAFPEWHMVGVRPIEDDEKEHYKAGTTELLVGLPPEGEDVIVWNKRFIFIDKLIKDSEGFYFEYDGNDVKVGYAWMRLPEPPPDHQYGKKHELLMSLRNDKERTAFLEDYRNTENGWEVWDKSLLGQRFWWAWEFPDRSRTIIVEEKLWDSIWPRKEKKWIPAEWFILQDKEQPLANQHASKTLALEEIKTYTRRLKEARKNGEER